MRRLRSQASNFAYQPLVSIIIPVYNPEREWLEQALDSVMSQVYSNWELCICDDGSNREGVREILSRYERLDDRIKVKYSERNTGISGASNEALSLAAGEFVGLLDHDDELTPDALFEIVKLLQEHPEADLVYTDEDKIDETGNRRGPHFKPDWSPDLLLSHNYITHLCVYRRQLLEQVGGFRKGFEGSQDYDLLLRVTEKTNNIYHIPKILYHWKMVEGSVTTGSENKSYTHERSRQALSEALERRGVKGSVEDGFARNFFRVNRDIVGTPKVSIIIPTRDNFSLLKNCVESIERLTTYRNYEILIVDNESIEPKTVEYLASTPHRVVRYEQEFSHSAINNFAVSRVKGEYILLLNDDTEVISGEWLEVMLQHAQRLEVGAVGAKLLFPDNLIQHAGVATGIGIPWDSGIAGHVHHSYPSSSQGYVGAAKLIRNYSAVTAACMLLRRTVFEEIGGFDEANLPTVYNDVDLCMRIRKAGYLIIYTPYAELYHHETASRKRGIDPATHNYLRERWGEVLDRDPYYNPNFSRGRGDFNLRADMLRPRALRTDSSRNDLESDKNQKAMDKQEAQTHIEKQQRKIRDSFRTTLAPVPVNRSSETSLLRDLQHSDPPNRQRNESFAANSRTRTSSITESVSGLEDVPRIDQLVWIFGSPRTGSTWLARMMTELNSHVYWHEPYVGSLFGSFLFEKYDPEKNAANRVLQNSPAFIMGKPYRRAWLESVKNFVVDGVTARFSRLSSEQYLVIKEPNGSIGAPLLMEALPDSRMIFLLRDSRDVVASRLDAHRKGSWGQQGWEYDTTEKLNAYTEQLAEEYIRAVSLTKKAYDAHTGKKAFVRYEDLRHNTFDTLKFMYNSLEIEVDQLQLGASVEKHSWEQITDTAKGPGKGFRKAQPGGWKDDLSSEQVDIVENITSPILSQFYSLSRETRA